MKLNLQQSGSFIGISGMAAVGFLYFFSGLLAPTWAVIVLCLFWFALLLVAFRWFMPHPLRVFALPFVAFAVWFAAMTLGDIFLHWTA